ncbi:S9 family peptidase [Candidatus Dependentiae bacterium]|nr:S9 family peptidase [Candidatus Dependentiae bacterium]
MIRKYYENNLKTSLKTLLLIFILSLVWLINFNGIFTSRKSTPVGLIPREELFQFNMQYDLRISPDGKNIIYRRSESGEISLMVYNIKTGDKSLLVEAGDNVISEFEWLSDSENIIYLMDQSANELDRLFKISITDKVNQQLSTDDMINVKILSLRWSGDSRNNLKIKAFSKKELSWILYDYDIRENTWEEINKISPYTMEMFFDHNQDLYAYKFFNPKDQNVVFSIWNDKTKTFDSGFSMGLLSQYFFKPMRISKDKKYITYLGINKRTLHYEVIKYNTQNLVEEIIYIAKDHDVFYPIFDRNNENILALLRTTKKGSEWVFFDKKIKRKSKFITRKFKSEPWSFSTWDTQSLSIVSTYSDKNPGTFYLANHKKRKVKKLWDQAPGLKKYTLADHEPFSFIVRDGKIIHGYLTFPVNKKRENLPAVLLVHGGPDVFNPWYYNPHSQWLANRGYLVIDINYRGTRGYGAEYCICGFREWGAKMQDDLIDGVNWVIERGYANPERIAIMGGSYGGYAALCGAAFTPDKFKCAISINGVSNLITMVKYFYGHAAVSFYIRVGDWEKDSQRLMQNSPLYYTQKIKIPIFLVHGEKDHIVKLQETLQFKQLLEEHKVEHKYMSFEDETHNFRKPKNILILYREIEKFLADNLGGEYQEPTSEEIRIIEQ